MSEPDMLAATRAQLETILVVDDAPTNLRHVQGHLVGAGYAVIPADSGQRALEIFGEKAPDLVLLDVLMPELDGFETCRRIRVLRGGAETPIIFLTALDDLATHRRAIVSGADDLLIKPIDRTALLMRVRSLIRLKRLIDEIRRVNGQRERMTAFIVHDLNNPLTGILANAEFMERDPEMAARSRNSLSQIRTAGETLRRMVASLLDVRRSEDGTLTPILEEFDLAELADEIACPAGHRAERHAKRLALLRAPGRVPVTADRDLIRRLIENLIDNAMRRSRSGGSIRLEVNAAEPGFCRIDVRDHGPVLSEEERDGLFERGLSLAYCHAAVTAHGGRIWLEQTEPEGAAIRVRLPLRPPAGRS